MMQKLGIEHFLSKIYDVDKLKYLLINKEAVRLIPQMALPKLEKTEKDSVNKMVIDLPKVDGISVTELEEFWKINEFKHYEESLPLGKGEIIRSPSQVEWK
jgi:hypothetical protein